MWQTCENVHFNVKDGEMPLFRDGHWTGIQAAP